MAMRALVGCTIVLLVSASVANAAKGQTCGSDYADESAGQQLLQAKAGVWREVSWEVGQAKCKKWCHDPARSGGIGWAEKCGNRRCQACAECQTTTPPSQTTTPPSTPRPDLPACQFAEGGGGAAQQITVASASHFKARLLKPDAVDGDVTYAFVEAPEGLGVNMRDGTVTWQPDVSQVGGHVAIASAASAGGSSDCLLQVTVTKGAANPSGAIYVSPLRGSDTASGSIEAPMATVGAAVRAASPGQIIYVRGGAYLLEKEEKVEATATAANPIVVTRLPGERVRFTVGPNSIGFNIPEGSTGVTFRGLEIYGAAEEDDHWEVLRTSWWRVEDKRVGGKTAFQVDGQHVVIEECVIHDLHQKGVNIYAGRYVTVRNNIIYNIGHASLSGGHGVMRKWARTYGNPDDPRYFRFDVYGNLIFAVEQRIYSFIPSKRYCNMHIDEGKGILLDITKDKSMKARVAHNLVLYGGADHIRLKWNPNLQVHNNAVMAEEGRIDPIPDGITFKNDLKPSPNLTFIGNLVQSFVGSMPFDVSEHFTAADHPGRVRQNYYAGGGQARGSTPGVEELTAGASVFQDPAKLDFRKSGAVPGDVGVSEAVLQSLMAMAADYAVKIAPSGWRHDHEGNVEVIEASAPMEHLHPPARGPSKKFKGRQALFYKVRSEWYKKMCKCNELEIVLPAYGDHSH